MLKTVSFIIISFLYSISVLATVPDSVYISGTDIKLLHYTDSVVHIKKIGFEGKYGIYVEEYIASKHDSIYYINSKDIYPYNIFKTNYRLKDELLGKMLPATTDYDYIFYDTNRYVVKSKTGSTNSDIWRTCTVDGLDFAILYRSDDYFREKSNSQKYNEPFDESQVRYYINKLIFPLADGQYWVGDSIVTARENEYDIKKILKRRDYINDCDTLQIAGKYGLFTLTGQEIIPAVYDSIKTDNYRVRSFLNGRIYLLDYLGNMIAENLRAAIPVGMYQIIDDDGKMYYMNSDGLKLDSISTHWTMSVDDILYPLGIDVVLLPPKKVHSKKYKAYTWVNFIYPYHGEKSFDELKKERSFSSGNFHAYLDFEENTVEYYGLDRINWINSDYWNQRDEMYGYEVEAYHLPKEYKDPKLVSGGNNYQHTGDYVLLPSSWIIAKKKGKYGVFDIHEPDKAILPFVYDKITGKNTHLILEKKGLTAYYPINSTPRYKILKPFIRAFARFQLPDGRWGWLDKYGQEYIDNE